MRWAAFVAAIARALIGWVLSFSIAIACYGPSLENTFLYDKEDLDRVEAPAIIEVTILRISSASDNRYTAGVSRVETVIKGGFDDGIIKVLANPSNCTRGFEVGTRGFVIGSLQRDLDGSLNLIAIPEMLDDREARRALFRAKKP